MCHISQMEKDDVSFTLCGNDLTSSVLRGWGRDGGMKDGGGWGVRVEEEGIGSTWCQR